MKTKINLEKDIEVTSSSPDDLRLRKKWGFISAKAEASRVVGNEQNGWGVEIAESGKE